MDNAKIQKVTELGNTDIHIEQWNLMEIHAKHKITNIILKKGITDLQKY